MRRTSPFSPASPSLFWYSDSISSATDYATSSTANRRLRDERVIALFGLACGHGVAETTSRVAEIMKRERIDRHAGDRALQDTLGLSDIARQKQRASVE